MCSYLYPQLSCGDHLLIMNQWQVISKGRFSIRKKKMNGGLLTTFPELFEIMNIQNVQYTMVSNGYGARIICHLGY